MGGRSTFFCGHGCYDTKYRGLSYDLVPVLLVVSFSLLGLLLGDYMPFPFPRRRTPHSNARMYSPRLRRILARGGSTPTPTNSDVHLNRAVAVGGA